METSFHPRGSKHDLPSKIYLPSFHGTWYTEYVHPTINTFTPTNVGMTIPFYGIINTFFFAMTRMVNHDEQNS